MAVRRKADDDTVPPTCAGAKSNGRYPVPVHLIDSGEMREISEATISHFVDEVDADVFALLAAELQVEDRTVGVLAEPAEDDDRQSEGDACRRQDRAKRAAPDLSEDHHGGLMNPPKPGHALDRRGTVTRW